MSHFYFIRHAPTLNNLKNIRCGGDVDLPLIEDFQKYIEDSLHEIKKASISKIYTSPLIRTTSTAAFIAQHLTTNPIISTDNRIKERALGKLNFLDINATQEILRNPPAEYDVEDNCIFQERVIDFINQIKEIECNTLNTTLIVSSKGIARVLTEHFEYEKVNGGNDIYANCQLIKFFIN